MLGWIILAAIEGFITLQTNLWPHLGRFSCFNWGKKTQPKCEGCLSRGWTSTLNETETISWAPALVSLWNLIVAMGDPSQAPSFMPSPPWWITSPGTVSQDQSFLFKTAFVRWFGSSMRQAINADTFLHKFQCLRACWPYPVWHTMTFIILY